MKKKIVYLMLFALTASLLTACAPTAKTEYVFISRIEKKECYLCSDTGDDTIEELCTHANVGIINVNTFEMMELEIIRYDEKGDPIMEATGTMRMCGSTLGEIRVTGMVDPDRGYASVNFAPEEATIDEKKIGQFLCQECLDEFASACHSGEKISPIAIVELKHRVLSPLLETTPCFVCGDYLVTVNYNEDGRIGVVTIYNPTRFQDNECAAG